MSFNNKLKFRTTDEMDALVLKLVKDFHIENQLSADKKTIRQRKKQVMHVMREAASSISLKTVAKKG